jgi:hypothetical protein
LNTVEYSVNEVKNKAQVDVMNGFQNIVQGQPRGTRPSRLSPEINEFLHMLDALEGQLQVKDTKTTAKS